MQDDGGLVCALTSQLLFHEDPRGTQRAVLMESRPRNLVSTLSLQASGPQLVSNISMPLKEIIRKVAQAETPSLFTVDWVYMILAFYAGQKVNACL